MTRYIWSTSALLLLLGVNGFASDDGDRDKLLGSWVEAGNGATSGWTIARNGDSFQITRFQAANAITTYPCKVDGRECEVKISGKKATVSMWFNGPKLVQTESQGSSVVKRRFAVLPQGDTMELEIMPIVPSGKTETIQFKRAPPSGQGKQ
jgi:hypothetical protein